MKIAHNLPELQHQAQLKGLALTRAWVGDIHGYLFLFEGKPVEAVINLKECNEFLSGNLALHPNLKRYMGGEA